LETPVASANDAAFKAAFQKRKLAKSYFKRYLPRQIVRKIDFRTLKLNNRSYVDEKLRDKHSDIVYRVRIAGKPAFLYILFEHQSAPDHWMVFRLLCYMINIWREFLEENPKAKQLPPVLPLVLYHGERTWNSPRAFAEIVQDPGGLEAYIPQFAYDLHDLGQSPDESLFLGDSIALGVVLYLMKHIHAPDFADRFERAARYLGTIDDRKVQLEFLEWMLRYAYHAREDDREAIDRGIEALDNQNARRMAMTIAERLKKEGRQEGRQEGLQEGLQKGRLTSIRKFLVQRFGTISPGLEKKLVASDLEALDQFLDRILSFQDLNEAESWWEGRGKTGNA